MASGKSLDFSVPLFAHLKNEVKVFPLLGVLQQLNALIRKTYFSNSCTVTAISTTIKDFLCERVKM